MMKNKTKNGFTIVEMLIYAGLLTLFLGVLSNLFLTAMDIKISSESDSYMSQDARFIITRLGYDLKRADSVVSPALGQTGSTLVLSIGGVNYTYTYNANALTLTSNSQTSSLQSSEVTLSNVSFQRLGNVNGKNTIKVTFNINGEVSSTTLGTR